MPRRSQPMMFQKNLSLQSMKLPKRNLPMTYQRSKSTVKPMLLLMLHLSQHTSLSQLTSLRNLSISLHQHNHQHLTSFMLDIHQFISINSLKWKLCKLLLLSTTHQQNKHTTLQQNRATKPVNPSLYMMLPNQHTMHQRSQAMICQSQSIMHPKNLHINHLNLLTSQNPSHQLIRHLRSLNTKPLRSKNTKLHKSLPIIYPRSQLITLLRNQLTILPRNLLIIHLNSHTMFLSQDIMLLSQHTILLSNHTMSPQNQHTLPLRSHLTILLQSLFTVHQRSLLTSLPSLSHLSMNQPRSHPTILLRSHLTILLRSLLIILLRSLLIIHPSQAISLDPH